MYKTLLDALLEEGETSSFLSFVEEALLSDTWHEDGIQEEILEVLTPLISEREDMGAFQDLDRLALHVQVASVTKNLVCFGKRSQNQQYAKTSIAYVEGLLKSSEECNADFDVLQSATRSALVAQMNYSLASMIKHLHQRSIASNPKVR